MLEIIKKYSDQIKPYKVKNTWYDTRADKETRYYNYYKNKEGITLEEKERFAIELLKMSLEKSANPVVSCSFGIDSIITLYLTRKALIEMGKDASDVQVVWNDTLNEFQETRFFAKQIKDDWNLDLVITRPEKSLKRVIDDNGGVTSDYFFTRKGDRRKGVPLSEKCCGTLKHAPMRKAIKASNWDLMINGLRADESTQRLRAGLRDGEYFYSSAEWKAMVCRPILWFTEEDVWSYVFKYNVPYNPVYNNNYIIEYPDDSILEDNLDLISFARLKVQDLKDRKVNIVDKRQAIILNSIEGFKISRPVRVGCMMCPIPIKYGYMEWIRKFYPKVFNAMVYNLGYGKAMLSMIPDEAKEEIKAFTGIDVNEETAVDHLKEILEAKPCTFDRFTM